MWIAHIKLNDNALYEHTMNNRKQWHKENRERINASKRTSVKHKASNLRAQKKYRKKNPGYNAKMCKNLRDKNRSELNDAYFRLLLLNEKVPKETITPEMIEARRQRYIAKHGLSNKPKIKDMPQEKAELASRWELIAAKRKQMQE